MRSKICIEFNVFAEIVRISMRGEFLKFEDRDEYTAANSVVFKRNSFCHLCRLYCRSLLFVVVSDSTLIITRWGSFIVVFPQ